MKMRRYVRNALMGVGMICGIALVDALIEHAKALCSIATLGKPLHILLLDPAQRHPIWVDAPLGGSRAKARHDRAMSILR